MHYSVIKEVRITNVDDIHMSGKSAFIARGETGFTHQGHKEGLITPAEGIDRDRGCCEGDPNPRPPDVSDDGAQTFARNPMSLAP